MTTLNLRYIKGDFLVTGPDIEPRKFKTRREAKARLSRNKQLAAQFGVATRTIQARRLVFSIARRPGSQDIPTPEPGEDAATSWSEVID